MAVDLAALAIDVRSWSDQYLAEQMALGRDGYSDPGAWAVLAAEAGRRSPAPAPAAQAETQPDRPIAESASTQAKRTLSNSWTWFEQRSFLLVPLILGLLAAMRHVEHLGIFLAVAAVLVSPRTLSRIRLKAVAIDPLFLYVTGFREEVAVPLTDVDRATQSFSLLAGARLVTIHFTHLTPVGWRITFLPAFTRVELSSTTCNRAIAEIEVAVQRARGAS